MAVPQFLLSRSGPASAAKVVHFSFLCAQPKISVLIHNLNRAYFLKVSLDSIIVQTYRPLEIIILDAGSSDQSKDLINEYSSLMIDAGIEFRSYSCPVMGVPASRNLAARYASGDVLFFLDNDASLVGEKALEEVIRIYKKNPSISALSPQILRGDSSDMDPFAWIYRRNPRKWRNRCFLTFSFAGTGFCILRKSFERIGGFWEALDYSREEEEFCLGLVHLGEAILYIPQIMVRHYADPKGRINLQERRYVELLNGTLIYWRRFPFPNPPIFILARTFSMSLRSVIKEKTSPLYLLPAIRHAAREWRGKNLKRKPVSYHTVWRYLCLHFKS